MTVYDVTKAPIKEKTAAVTASVSHSELHVEPSKSHAVNSSGSISRYHADLTLDLRRATDCQNATFLCELDFMNLALDSQQKTVAPAANTCQVNSSEQVGSFSDLNYRTNQIEQDLTKLTNEYSDLEKQLDTPFTDSLALAL